MRITRIWAFLSAITMLSWALVSARGAGEFSPSVLVTVGVLAIAAVKARFIIRHFIGVQAAPTWLRVVTDTWLATLSTVILALYPYSRL
jgi:hypothetical protein